MENYRLVHGNAFDELLKLEVNSIDFVVTDPPYFIDGMGDDWDKERLKKRAAKSGVIGSLPVGMKFDSRQGKNFQVFVARVAPMVFRVLKPGGFFVCFSQARLYHRMAVAVEDAGFEIRDMLGWKYEGQAKAFSQDHFLLRKVKAGKMTQERAGVITESLGGRKTPQLKPQIEPMVLAQKPREGTFIDNWMKWEVGLVDTTQTLDGKFPGNIMDVSKPTRREKGSENIHMTVKPVVLLEHLIRLFTKPGQIVLDPFLGSGSHGVAALQANRKFIGIEIEQAYVEIAARRLEEAECNE